MNILKTGAAVLLGFVIGAAFYHPKTVNAGGLRLEKVRPGFNSVIGSDVKGLACNQDGCFVLTE